MTTPLRYGSITDLDPVRLRQDGATSSMIVSTVIGSVAVDDRVVWTVIDAQVVVFGTTSDVSVLTAGPSDWQWSMDGDAELADYEHAEFNMSGQDRTILLVVASCGGSAPTGDDLIVNVRRDGTDELFSSGLAIPDGEIVYSDTPDDQSWPDGSYLQVAVTQVGSTSPGNGLTVQVVAR